MPYRSQLKTICILVLGLSSCSTSSGQLSDPTSLNPPAATTGQTPGGATYQLFADGSGHVSSGSEKWTFSCKKDKITDKVECSIYGDKNALFIFFPDNRSGPQVCIMGHDFPGRRGAMRFDSNPPIAINESGCAPGSPLRQLLAARSFTLRAVKWPYDYPVDTTGTTQGLQEAVRFVEDLQATTRQK